MSDHLDNKWTLFYWEVRKNWNPFARFCCFGMHSLWALSCYEAEKCDMKLNIKLNSKKIIPFNLALMLCNSCIVCKNWKNVFCFCIFFFCYYSLISSIRAVILRAVEQCKCFSETTQNVFNLSVRPQYDPSSSAHGSAVHIVMQQETSARGEMLRVETRSSRKSFRKICRSFYAY